MTRPEVLDRRRPLQRWAAATLTAALLALAVAALWASWTQYRIMQTVATDGARASAYQLAALLSTRQESLLQGALNQPDGQDHQIILSGTGKLQAALENLVAADPDQADDNARLAEAADILGPATARYVTALEQGNIDDARRILEVELEPVAARIRTALLDEQARHVGRYAGSLDRAKRDSGVLVVGTALTMLLGVGVMAALTFRERSHRRAIERMALHDPLTGLPNRVAFHHQAQQALAAERIGSGGATVLIVDLDGFKEVNDNFGHHIGDELLIQVAQRLRGSVRGADTVARLGGDEFAVLLTDTVPGLAESVAGRLNQAFDEQFVVDGIVLDIEVSIGIASSGDGADTTTILQSADTAMYAAKEHRLGFTRFDPEQAHQTASRLTMLGDLRRALEADNEIELHYQPKIAVGTGAVTGAEALARWNHPVRGPVAPFEFIPVLEGTSLIHRFTARVLDLALGQARQWLDDGQRIPVAINASTRCLLDASFPGTVAKALQKAGLPGVMLCIEITESTVMANPEMAIAVLQQIRQLGVSTAIDDFGTGYSSMAYLKILPVDEIKVDRSFVRDMATDHSNHVLVESAIDLGHNLGLIVVAEGVEDEATATALQALGCDVAQGYHYAKPLPAGRFTDFLTERSVPR